MKVFCDIEANSLLPLLHTIHSLCVKEEGKETLSCTDSSTNYPAIAEGITMLEQATTIIGHNHLESLHKLFSFKNFSVSVSRIATKYISIPIKYSTNIINKYFLLLL